MNYKKFNYFIVVDKNYKPMSFVEKYRIFCYCDSELNGRPLPCQLYTKKEALLLIDKSTETKRFKGSSIIEYFLMPVNNLPITT